ncbi:MAG: SIS domain-containing protein [Desulfatiglandales bacterium]
MSEESQESVIETAKAVLKLEAQGILGLLKRIGPAFEEAVRMVLSSRGRVVLTGIGKSGLIARKIAATLTSTGTPSVFLHPVEALHGDLGMVREGDVVIAISNSGRTLELNKILPTLRELGAKIIGFLGDPISPMARYCDVIVDVGVEREACPLNLAPTSSTTAALAMGDALSVVLLKQKEFKEEDFRRFHPGGSLGERLRSKVFQVMSKGEKAPMVYKGARLMDAIVEMDKKTLGAVIVIEEGRTPAGIITDGDLRRAILKGVDLRSATVDDIMTVSPKTISMHQNNSEALRLMEIHEIMHLVVVDDSHKVVGLLHLHDLLGREDFRLNGQ